MENISKINVNDTDYSLKDKESRQMASILPLMLPSLLEGISHTTSIEDNEEWQMLLLDSEGKILAGVRQDGTSYCGYEDYSELYTQLLSMYQTTETSV